MITVNDLMTVDPQTIAPDTTLRRIIEIMKQENCRQLPVVDESKLLGIVTDRDIRLVMNSPIVWHRQWQDEEIMDKVVAEGVMTPNPLTVSPDTLAYKAAEMLSTYKFGALPVVEGEVLVGIITVTDFLDHIAETWAEKAITCLD
jgi:acetoin utilization protein AcuB